ncbi:anoctamin-10-like [Sardina pilchardus]|uniref:anoctamin-10-like n=1 Tax=Sardina pilchardus TaxID=27697 RepID=UPI002E143D50
MAPMVLLKFHPKVTTKAVDWLMGKISAPESQGGADLPCRLLGNSKQGEPAVVVGASIERLLLEADESILFRHKPYSSAVRLCEAVCSDAQGVNLGPETQGEVKPGEADEERRSAADGLHGMISSAEAVSLLLKVLGQLKVGDAEEVNVLPNVSLTPGEPVISSMLHHGAITAAYPLHEVPVLKHLERKWRASWFGFKPFCQREILEDIMDYFGRPVALYFGLMWTLANALLQKSVLYLCLHLCLMQECNAPLLSFAGVVWSRLFLRGWRLKSEALKAEWGSGEPMQRHWPFGSPPSTRQNQENLSADTGWKRIPRSVLFLTITVSMTSMVTATYLYLDETFKNHFSADKPKSPYSHLCLYLPDVFLSVTMTALDWFAVELSGHLNSRSASPSSSSSPGSQHSSQQPHLLPELVMFCLFNHFGVHFYQALQLRELSGVGQRISVQLATQCALNLLLSLLLPCAKQRAVRGTDWTTAGVLPVLQQIQRQCDWPSFDNSQTRCYLELLTSYGYVMLFSSVSPQCVLWCWAAMFLKSWLDMWRLGWAVCRPLPCEAPAAGVGVVVWQEVFLVVETLAVLGNTVLLQSSAEAEELLRDLSPWERTQLALGLQLFLLALGGTAANLAFGFFRAVGWHAEQPDGQRQHRHYRIHRQQQQHQRLPPEANE